MSQEIRNSFTEAYSNNGGEGNESDSATSTVEEVQSQAAVPSLDGLKTWANQHEPLTLATATAFTTLLLFNKTARKCVWSIAQFLLGLISPTLGDKNPFHSTSGWAKGTAQGLVWLILVAGLSVLPFILM